MYLLINKMPNKHLLFNLYLGFKDFLLKLYHTFDFNTFQSLDLIKYVHVPFLLLGFNVGGKQEEE